MHFWMAAAFVMARSRLICLDYTQLCDFVKDERLLLQLCLDWELERPYPEPKLLPGFKVSLKCIVCVSKMQQMWPLCHASHKI